MNVDVGATGRSGTWLAQWLAAFLDADPDVSERDFLVLGEIRGYLEETTNHEIRRHDVIR